LLLITTALTAPMPETLVVPPLQGDPSARPPPPPRQGPRQLLSSLLGLADLCPEEWPHRGASQVAARQRDAAAAATAGGAGDNTSEGALFCTIVRMHLVSCGILAWT
jgi:hypothetical protein